MALQLVAPRRTLEQLKALAASGSTRFARKAQAELRERINEQLRHDVGGAQ